MEMQPDEKDLSTILSVMTTEYYNLQSARSIATSESMGRSSLYLSTVSTTLVALAFVGQLSRQGVGFFLFALVLFPSLFFLGLVTFQRSAQISLEDIRYARGMSRIRHLFLEILPRMQNYFVLPTSDDVKSASADITATGGRLGNWWQVFLTMPGMISVINSLIAGAFFSTLAAFLFGLTLEVSVVVGAIAFLVVVVLFYRSQWTTWGKAQESLASLFPSDLLSQRNASSE